MTQEIPLYTTRQLAELLGVDNSTVRRWVSSGKVAPAIVTPGGHMRFDQAAVDRLLGNATKVAS